MEFKEHNVEYGFRAQSAAVVGDGTLELADVDDVRIYQPSTWAGSPLPHAWVERAGERPPLRSVAPALALIAGEQGQEWCTAEKAAAEWLDLVAVRVGHTRGRLAGPAAGLRPRPRGRAGRRDPGPPRPGDRLALDQRVAGCGGRGRGGAGSGSGPGRLSNRPVGRVAASAGPGHGRGRRRRTTGSAPASITRRASCVRELTPSLRNTLCRWYSTVLGLMNNCVAMSRLACPRLTRVAIRASVESVPDGRGWRSPACSPVARSLTRERRRRRRGAAPRTCRGRRNRRAGPRRRCRRSHSP